MCPKPLSVQNLTNKVSKIQWKWPKLAKNCPKLNVSKTSKCPKPNKQGVQNSKKVTKTGKELSKTQWKCPKLNVSKTSKCPNPNKQGVQNSLKMPKTGKELSKTQCVQNIKVPMERIILTFYLK